MKNRNMDADPPGFFPLFIPVAGKRVLVIGGGAVALRRVQTLLSFDCVVHVITKEPCPGLEALAAECFRTGRELTLERRSFVPGDCVKGGRPVFVIAATNSRTVNHAIARECAGRDIPVSVADCKEESTFYFPAVAVHDRIVAGVSSCGQDYHAVRKAAAAIREVLRNEDTNRDS
jgi:siroheme synthase-like protein